MNWIILKGEQTRTRSTNLFPEQTFPGREECALEERMLENAFHTAQCLDHIGTVVVQRPQLAVVTSVSPPEHIHTKRLVSLKVGANTPSFIIGQGMTVFLEESVDLKDVNKRERDREIDRNEQRCVRKKESTSTSTI